ncbi:MAG: NAD-dependent epimerase/dehydratase family protein [Deltaproteobacteria bacterium]|nr:MAG: NAD-dependent epimerase/dehydratase family protein [Deltaproteobacteria bacterium]
MSHILVTGSNGFLGSALVRCLAERGAGRLRCLVRPGSDRSRLEQTVAHFGDAIDIVRGTLTRPADCEAAVDGVDVVYHLAAAPSGAPADMFFNTVVGTRNLLDAIAARAAAGHRVKLVFCSSLSVYGVADLPAGAVVDESTPLEPHPERRDVYAHTKLRQEQLCWDYQTRHGFPMVVLRPGVIYGPGGGAISARVGLELFGVFLHLGRDTVLPLTYVDNCAEAFAIAGDDDRAVGRVFNVIDDDLPTARAFLRAYRKCVRRVPVVSLPYAATRWMSRAVEWYADWSGGQLPAVFTPYKTASMWKGNRFDNGRLKALGWRPRVATADGMRRHFDALAAAAGVAGRS